jgi:hypothetical protein
MVVDILARMVWMSRSAAFCHFLVGGRILMGAVVGLVKFLEERGAEGAVEVAAEVWLV